jgi:CDP-glucose 4,6-dehydratase
MANLPHESFWSGKRVLVTGHTGFKGGWLALWLSRLGAEVTGFSLPPPARPNLFDAARVRELVDSRLGDIRDLSLFQSVGRSARPDIVLHLAAQPLVSAGYTEPVATFETNLMGTVNALQMTRDTPDARVILVITTDKVYEERRGQWSHVEEDSLGGHDPYSASKAACEIVAASYRDSFLNAQGVCVATCRAGNVIGGGDWSPNRLMPDVVKAWQAGEPVVLRNPSFVRPWQHVLEPLAGYLLLAQGLWEGRVQPGAFNFGPRPGHEVDVGSLVDMARQTCGLLGDWVLTDGASLGKENPWLSLDPRKADSALHLPSWPLEMAVERTMTWYRRHGDGHPARKLCINDIDTFNATASSPN